MKIQKEKEENKQIALQYELDEIHKDLNYKKVMRAE
jgi:hypothetical protein